MTRFILLAATAAIAATAATPASADITAFANYSGVGGANMFWLRTGTTYSSVGTPTQIAASRASAIATASGRFFTIATPTITNAGTVASKFTFLIPVLYALGQFDASYHFDATATNGSIAQTAGSFVYQPIVSGTFAFIYTGAGEITVNHVVYHTGSNLLPATFTGGSIASQNSATSGSATRIDFGRRRDDYLYLRLHRFFAHDRSGSVDQPIVDYERAQRWVVSGAPLVRDENDRIVFDRPAADPDVDDTQA